MPAAESSQIDAPISIGNLFPDSSSSSSECENDDFDPCYETQSIDLCGKTIFVRQYAFHSQNANQVWPGTFNLAEFLFQRKSETTIIGEQKESSEETTNDTEFGETNNVGGYDRYWGSVLELGTATGLLSIRLALAASSVDNNAESCSEEEGSMTKFVCSSVVTSDVDDEFGDVEHNLLHNFRINGFGSKRDSIDDGNNRIAWMRMPIHVPHTWGSGWRLSASKRGMENQTFHTIVASDILLYVSQYSALVETLTEIFDHCTTESQSTTTATNMREKSPVFVMSWNRRIKESSDFFVRMEQAGFSCNHEGKCIYTFTRG